MDSRFRGNDAGLKNTPSAAPADPGRFFFATPKKVPRPDLIDRAESYIVTKFDRLDRENFPGDARIRVFSRSIVH